MTRGSAYACAVVLALLGLLGMPSAAQAASTGNPHVTVQLSSKVVHTGQQFTVVSRANVLCDWIVTFRGDRRHTVGRANTSSFVAPDVSRRTTFPLEVTCVLHSVPAQHVTTGSKAVSGGHGASETLVVRIPPNTHVVTPVVVDPGTIVKPPHTGGDHPGGLPNTGGPPLWLLLAGLLTVVGGAVLVRGSADR
jgi:hypothetical protein